MNWLIGVAAVVCILWGARRLDRFESELADDDWTPPMFRGSLAVVEIDGATYDAIFYGAPVLDRAALVDLPFSPVISDEDALRLLEEIRGLPERRLAS